MKSKRIMKKVIKAGAALLLLGIAGSIYITVINRPRSYAVAYAKTESIQETLKVSGDVKSNEAKTYYAMFTAPIAELEVEEGEIVHEGEQLVTFDTEDLTLEARQSALAVKAAENQYQSTVKQNEKNTLIYQGAAMSKAAFEELIAGQRDVIKGLQAKVTKAENKANDIAILQNRVNMEVDEDDKEELQKTLDEWKGEYKDYNVPEVTSELAKQQAILSDMQAYRTQYETQKQTADNKMIDSEAQAEILTNKQSAVLSKQDKDATLEEASAGICADYTGIVSKVYVEEGATVNQGTPLFRLEDSQDMAVDAMVSKYDIDKVKAGQKATITIAGHTYDGEVTKIDRVATTDSSDKAKIPVTVTIQKPDKSVYIGIEADVEINIAEKENAVVVPMEAVYTDDAGSYCYGIDDNRIVRNDIKTGLKNISTVEIAEGLQPGDAVIIDAVTEQELGTKALGEEQK